MNNEKNTEKRYISLENVPKGAKTVMARLREHGFEAYLVGGCVRDCLLGKTPNDWDITTNALPGQSQAVFADFHVVETGLKHGTLTVVVDKLPYEVTTYRVDGTYLDNRHPENVSFTQSLAEDLSRRDFTVNAMAADENGLVVDLFGGIDDLAGGVIRAVGDPDRRFAEDGLRIMRALRFASVLGFAPDDRLTASVHRNRELLRNISVERIYSELSRMLCGAGVFSVLSAFPDVLGVFLPEILPTVGFAQNNPHHAYDVWTHTVHAVAAAPADRVVRLALLFHDLGKPSCYTEDERGGHFYGHHAQSAGIARNVLNRLHSDNETKDSVVTLVDLHDTVFSVESAKQIRRLLARIGPDLMRRLLAVHRADIAGQGSAETAARLADCDTLEKILADVLAAESCFSLRDLAVKGGDLMALGMKAGAQLGTVLDKLLSYVVDGTLPNQKEILLAKAEEIIHSKTITQEETP